MYIDNKYWDNYIGDTDDSLTLVDYLSEKQKEEISVEEIFSDFGLDKLNGRFRKPDISLTFENPNHEELEIHYAIVLITDVAALLLECKINGRVNLCELSGDSSDNSSYIQITATQADIELINNAISDFVAAPLSYDLTEMAPEDDMLQMSLICEKLRTELMEQ